MPALNTPATVDVKTKMPSGTDAVAVFIAEGNKDAGEAGNRLTDGERGAVDRLISAGVSRGKAKELQFDLIDGAGRKSSGARRVVVVGIGPAEKVTNESIRQAAGLLAKAARKQRLKTIAIALPNLHRGGDASPATGPAATAEAVATGILLASFDFEEYKGTASKKKSSDDDAKAVRAFTILTDEGDLSEAKRGVERARLIVEGQNFARTIASRPGNVINPPALAKVAQEMARDVGLAYRVLDEKQMQKLGMGGILAVGAGSEVTPPRMIVLEWRGAGFKGQGSAKNKGKVKAISDASSSLTPTPGTLTPLL